MYRTFYSKILLFGEYALMCGSEALSIPCNRFYGRFTFQKQEQAIPGFDPEEHLAKYLSYLKSLPPGQAKDLNLDLERLESDLKRGLTVDSNIPPGYGLGSSGALVAAIYDFYARNKPEETDENPRTLERLRNLFSVMESYFHGKSSGFDPLVSYLSRPVMRNGDGTLTVVKMPDENPGGQGALFLLDTRHSGETRPLVNDFIERCKNPDFKEKITQNLNGFNRDAINGFLNGRFIALEDSFKNISEFTLQNFSGMIPAALINDWRKGVESGAYYLKLCGSGGGGMMLGYSKNFAETSKLLSRWPLFSVLRF